MFDKNTKNELDKLIENKILPGVISCGIDPESIGFDAAVGYIVKKLMNSALSD